MPSSGTSWIPAARNCAYTYMKDLMLAQGIVGNYGPLLGSLGIYLLVFAKLIVQRWRRSSITAESSGANQAANRQQTRRIRVTRSFFAASLVHCCCLLPGTLSASLGWDVSHPQLTLVFRPLFVVGYTLCPVRQVAAVHTDFRVSALFQIIVCALNGRYRKAIGRILGGEVAVSNAATSIAMTKNQPESRSRRQS